MKKRNFPFHMTAGVLAVLSTLSDVGFAQGVNDASVQLQRVQIIEKQNNGYDANSAISTLKSDTPLSETPFSVQVVTEALMRDQQAYRLEDVVRNVSGLSSQPVPYSAAYETLQSRGFAVQPFRDGVRMQFLTVPLANAERVEVFKGPAAVQFGRVDPGGMVNVVTKQPQAQSLAELELQAGSFGMWRSTLDLAGALTQDGQWQYRLDGEWLDKRLFVDHTLDKRTFIAPSVAWRPNAATRVTLQYEYRDEKENGGVGVPAVGQRPAGVRIANYFSEPGLANHFMAHALNVRLEQQLTDGWNLRGSIGVYRGNYKYANITGGALLDDHVTLSRWGLASDYDHRDSNDATLDLVGKFSTGKLQHSVVLGVDNHRFDNNGNWSDQVPADINIEHPQYVVNLRDFYAAAPTSFWTRRDQWTGLYVQDQIRFDDAWQLLVGARHDRTDMVTGYSGISMDDAHAQAVPKKEQKTSPKFGVVYKATPTLNLYVSHASAFGGWPGTSLTKSGQLVEPETSAQWEAGLKAESLQGRLSTTVAVYDLRKQHVATPDPTDNRFVVSLGEVRSRGLELDVNGQLGAGWRISANYAYNAAAVTRSFAGDQGQGLPNAPRHSGALWLKNEPSTTQGLSYGLGVSGASASLGDGSGSFVMPGYGRVDVLAAYHFKWAGHASTLQLNVNNLLDRVYYPSAQGRAAIMPGEPRNLLLALRVGL